MLANAILFDRSRAVIDWKCPRARMLGYELDGKGVQSDGLAMELFTGTIIHDGLAGIANGVSIDAIADAAATQMFTTVTEHSNAEGAAAADVEVYAREQAALTEGLLRGFYKHVWPRMMAQYPEIVAVEKELLYTYTPKNTTFSNQPVQFMAKPDLLVRDKEGLIWYIEYKSTSSNKDTWVNSWSSAVQLHSSIKAVEQHFGEKPAGVIVQGLYKGYVSYGKQTSPFCYAYHRPGNPPLVKDSWSYSYIAGHKKFPVWEKDGGVRAWVANMPLEIIQEQFPQTPPIFVREDLVDAFFEQQGLREQEICDAMFVLRANGGDESRKIDIINEVFPQRFDQCVPSFGKACQFGRICHGQQGINPLDHGFSYRQPHHAPELEAWEKGSNNA